MANNEDYMEEITDEYKALVKRFVKPTTTFLLDDVLRRFEELDSKKLEEKIEIVYRYEDVYPARLRRDDEIACKFICTVTKEFSINSPVYKNGLFKNKIL